MSAHKLEQSAWLRGKQAFEVRDNEDMIRVTTKFQTTLSEFQIPLNIVHPEPNRFKSTNMAGIITMSVFGALSLLFVILAILKDAALAMLLLFTLPLFFAGLRQHRRMSLDAQIFHSRINGQNLLVLWRNNPTIQEFEAFTKGLRERLLKVEIPIANPLNQSIADELRKLGELKKDGIITESEFAEAKAKLLGAFEQRKIGFK
jgi:hypothetical protein